MPVFNEKNECTGCAACAQKCPQRAISMQPDDEGFFYPVINETECIHCDLCRKICPQIHAHYIQHLNHKAQLFLGGVIRSEKILLKSSSGGAFTAICKALSENAVICGAVYDDKLQVHHTAIRNGDGTDIFRQSKYVQSNIGDIYLQVSDFLKNDETVLFSGTSCQVAGLYAYLHGKPEKLYTVDMVCHGVPSQKVFDAYIRSLKKRTGTEVKGFSFRDKSYFWGDWEIGTSRFDGKKWKHQAWGQDVYMTGFLRGLYYRPSCYLCQYANPEIQRPADITIGDFWGIDRLSSDFHDKKGASLIVVNSEKGMHLTEKMKESMDLIQVKRSDAVLENHNLIEPTKWNPNREAFFRRLKTGEDFCSIMKDFRKGKSHSQVVRVLATKIAPWLVEKKRTRIRQERKMR